MPLDMPEFTSGWVRELDPERVADLRDYLSRSRLSDAAREALVVAAGSAAETLDGLVAEDQSWAPVRERLEQRLKAARAVQRALSEYLNALQLAMTPREQVLLMRTADALEALRSGDNPPPSIPASSDPIYQQAAHEPAVALFGALSEQIGVLEHALAAYLAAVKNRPPGSPLIAFVRSLDGAWLRATGKRATFTRHEPDEGFETAGELIELSRLALACIPAVQQRYGTALEAAVRTAVKGRRRRKKPSKGA